VLPVPWYYANHWRPQRLLKISSLHRQSSLTKAKSISYFYIFFLQYFLATSPNDELTSSGTAKRIIANFRLLNDFVHAQESQRLIINRRCLWDS